MKKNSQDGQCQSIIYVNKLRSREIVAKATANRTYNPNPNKKRKSSATVYNVQKICKSHKPMFYSQ